MVKQKENPSVCRRWVLFFGVGSISRRGKKKKITFASSQKLWRITKELDEYYYEIRLAGVTIDRIRIEQPTLKFLKEKELL